MSREPANLNRVAVAELLGLTPMQVRRQLECCPAAGFPRGIPQGHPFALRWSRAAIAAFAAGQLRGADTKPQPQRS